MDLLMMGSFRTEGGRVGNNLILQVFSYVYDWKVNPATPISDEERFSPYSINTLSSR